MTGTTYQERRAARLDDPRFEKFRNPVARRRLAAGLIALLVVEAGLFLLMDVSPVGAAVGMAVVVVAFVLLLGALKASTRGVEELTGEVLDERQAQVRGEVYATAYKVGSGLLVLGLAVVLLWTQIDLPAPGAGLVAGALVLPFHVAIVLPTLVAALRADV
ncbi:hypothetical protein [Micromonospora endolithica]|uniref:Uncharacterized protein n=1 Tax=Micromonospora endolithica TaxID=230091 RepID=A0A3A9YSC4_9ACTN|nr:hypothetical protein [Micromonospora endolithica]RKN38893.1 hypothetical protein D7223_30120 [Micromonospora endolithica]TWJ25519.1 hypothetical protein JD76_05692 [Micromonospora endolithica]